MEQVSFHGIGSMYHNKQHTTGLTDTDRLVSLSKSKSERTGMSVEEIYDDWRNQAPIGRLVHPLETAAAVVWMCLPSSGAIRGVSLAVDGGRMRSI